jgi:hypothetical protein
VAKAGAGSSAMTGLLVCHAPTNHGRHPFVEIDPVHSLGTYIFYG